MEAQIEENDELIFYNDINDLVDKLIFYKRNDKLRKKIAHNGRKKYFRLLNDLNSRTKNFLLCNIEKPEDDLMFALILKNLSDRQISLDKKLIHYIIKRIDRSYGKIIDFIYKIDEVSLKKKRSIDFKIIKEVLGE